MRCGVRYEILIWVHGVFFVCNLFVSSSAVTHSHVIYSEIKPAIWALRAIFHAFISGRLLWPLCIDFFTSRETSSAITLDAFVFVCSCVCVQSASLRRLFIIFSASQTWGTLAPRRRRVVYLHSLKSFYFRDATIYERMRPVADCRWILYAGLEVFELVDCEHLWLSNCLRWRRGEPLNRTRARSATSETFKSDRDKRATWGDRDSEAHVQAFFGLGAREGRNKLVFVGRVFLDKGLKFIFFNISPFGGLGFLFFLVLGSLCTSERNIYHRFTSSLCHGALFVSGSFICAQRKVRAGQNYFELGSPSRGFQSLRRRGEDARWFCYFFLFRMNA